MVLDGELARTILRGLAESHMHSQRMFDLLDGGARICIKLRFGDFGGLKADPPRSAALQLPHGHPTMGSTLRQRKTQLWISYAQKGSAMPRRERSVLNKLQD